MTRFARLLAAISAIGAINWGLIGFFNWNLVDAIFGGGSAEMTSAASRVVYALVGLCGIGLAALLPRLATTVATYRSSAAINAGTRRPEERERPRPESRS